MTTTFEAEWASLKQQAASRTEMHLASAAAAGGGGGEDLKSDKAVWNRASQDLGGLATNIKTTLTGLGDGQKGAAQAGVESSAAQDELYQSWKTYLESLAGKCSALQGPLRKAGEGQYANDEAIKDGFTQVDGQYQDTPATGGGAR